MKQAVIRLGCVCALFVAVQVGQAQQPDQLDDSFLKSVHPTMHLKAASGKSLNANKKDGITGVDSITTFNGSYNTDGYDSSGNFQHQWYYNMVGQSPDGGKTTVFNAPIIPVSIELLDANGNQRFVNGKPLYSDVTPFVQPVLNSPIFQPYSYTSSADPTQYTDAVQRAEFSHGNSDKWHTLLSPVVRSGYVMKLPLGSYQFALNADGTCCRYILANANTFESKLFPPTTPDSSTVIGNAEVTGQMTTKDITTTLFPNVFLYVGTPANCCILGFHSFDFEAGDASNGNLPRWYVMNYSSWISPGLFGAGFSDITALSHELSETFNDPFVVADGIHNLTPWWLSPNGNCQNDLEVGDVIEGLPNGTYPITMNGFTYHPQNEALLQWFEFKQTSNAIDHAYSYPDETVLTALSPIENVNCK
jgi:hypothetical protein